MPNKTNVANWAIVAALVTLTAVVALAFLIS